MKIMNIIELIILLVLIVTLIIFIVAVNSSGTKCMANPLNYAVKTLSTPSNEVSCLCSYENSSFNSIRTNLTGSYYVSPFNFNLN